MALSIQTTIFNLKKVLNIKDEKVKETVIIKPIKNKKEKKETPEYLYFAEKLNGQMAVSGAMISGLISSSIYIDPIDFAMKHPPEFGSIYNFLFFINYMSIQDLNTEKNILMFQRLIMSLWLGLIIKKALG